MTFNTKRSINGKSLRTILSMFRYLKRREDYSYGVFYNKSEDAYIYYLIEGMYGGLKNTIIKI